MPKGQARLSFEQGCFGSLFSITDTGRDILQGTQSVYQDEYLTGLWGRQQQRGDNPGKIALCMSSWAFSFFFFLVISILFFNVLLMFHSKFSFLNLFTDLDSSMMAPARPHWEPLILPRRCKSRAVTLEWQTVSLKAVLVIAVDIYWAIYSSEFC